METRWFYVPTSPHGASLLAVGAALPSRSMESRRGDLSIDPCVWLNLPLPHSCADPGPRLRGGTALSLSQAWLQGWHFG